MNIIIPRHYEDLQLTEREALLVAFMVMVAHDHGWEHNYNISPYDINKILDTLKAEIDSHKFTRLKEIFQFTYLNESNWMLKWKDFDPSWYTRGGAFKSFKYKLEDTRNQRVWCYLLGLYRGNKALVADSTRIFEHEDLYTKGMTNMEIDNFRIENRAYKNPNCKVQ
jgi:hypothetical protein